MNAVEPATFPPLPTEASGSKAPGWWGMWVLIMTESALFGSFIAGYFYLQALSPAWPQGGIENPDLRLAIPMTFILWSSSVPMIWAERGIKRGNQLALRLGLLLSFLLGAVFLGLEGTEWMNKGFRQDANAYASAFYTLTGFHGLHVLGGLTLNAVIQWRAWLGHFDERRHLAVQTTALYWHFVDTVWVFIFGTIYLSPRWLGA
jgi:heme/copper-type cytochrome/quinol oxidase subunit 3